MFILNLGLVFADKIGLNGFFFPPADSITFIILAAALALFTSGYLISIIKSTLDHSNELPDFKDMKETLWDGLKLIVVVFIYSIPLTPIYIIPFLFTPDKVPSSSLVSYVIPVSYIIPLIITFLLSVLTFMALGNMVRQKTIAGAFNFKEILNLIKKLRWKTYLIYVLIYTLIASAISLVQDLTVYWMYSPDYGVIIFLVWGLINTYLLAFQAEL